MKLLLVKGHETATGQKVMKLLLVKKFCNFYCSEGYETYAGQKVIKPNVCWSKGYETSAGQKVMNFLLVKRL